MSEQYRTYKIVRGSGMGGFLSPPGHWAHTWSLDEYTSPHGRKVIGCFGLDYVDNEHSHPTPAVRAQADRIRAEAETNLSELWIRHVYGYFRNSYVPESGSTNASDLIFPDQAKEVSAPVAEALRAAGYKRGGKAMIGPVAGFSLTVSDKTWNVHVRYVSGVEDFTATCPDRINEYAQALRVAGYGVEWHSDGHIWVPPLTPPAPLPPPERHRAVSLIREYYPDHEPRLDLITDSGKGYGSWPCGKCGERVQYEARLDALAVVSTRIFGSGITQWSYVTECSGGGKHEV